MTDNEDLFLTGVLPHPPSPSRFASSPYLFSQGRRGFNINIFSVLPLSFRRGAVGNMTGMRQTNKLGLTITEWEPSVASIFACLFLYLSKYFYVMKKKYKWGILAPGKMSAKFTKGLKLLDNVELYAVGSRDPERARQFAKEFGFKKSYGSYEELVLDPDLEIVYIASPHSYHYEHTLLCLKHKKAVICEKAFALNSREVKEMIR